jgi:hypothetical protein
MLLTGMGLPGTDPFSRPTSTQRQRAYAAALGGGTYTPELVIDGRQQVIGSREGEVRTALAIAQEQVSLVSVKIDFTPNRQMAITVGSSTSPADIWLVEYNPQAVTAVRGGENRGEMLTSINNVTSITNLGLTGAQPRILTVPLSTTLNNKYAVLVEAPAGGPILGAGTYVPSKF